MQIQEIERGWGPWRPLDMLQDAMAQALSGQRSAESMVYPALNVWSNETQAIVTAEIPGVGLQALEINVLGDTLTLRGQREPDALQEGETLLRTERISGAFSRSLQLPYHADAEKVTAQAKNGVLTITLPRAEAERPRKINIKAAS